MTSKIEWCDETANPITVKGGGHWCRKKSAGCDNCFAEAINTGNRFGFASGLSYTGKAPELELNREMLASWARKRVPKKIFVCSMTDWCGECVSREWQFETLNAMITAPKQTFMLLTKRADILLDVVHEYLKYNRQFWFRNDDNILICNLPKNIWLGVSVEDQSTANTRLPFLCELGDRFQANTFVSLDPLLKPVILGDAAKYIDLAIVGAEDIKGVKGKTRKDARPMDDNWVRSLRDEVKAAGKLFFYKQQLVNGRKVSLPELDGKVWSELPS